MADAVEPAPWMAPEAEHGPTLLYRDEWLVAVDKPSGLLVHRSEIDRHETRFALQEVRDLIGTRVYTATRPRSMPSSTWS